jgi:hypothetical protein
MNDAPVYFHLEPGAPPPDVSALSPFRAVVVVDTAVTSTWQSQMSEWLVKSGCLYMMAWGKDCSSWDDAVDIANLEQFDYGSIPEDRSVMTTWHDEQPLSDALDFCKRHANHPTVNLRYTILLHIADRSDSARLLKAYAEA